MEENVLKELQEIFGGEYVSSDRFLQSKSYDLWPYHLLIKKRDKKYAQYVVMPHGKEANEQLQELIFCAKKYGRKIIVRGGGSGVCGAIHTTNGDEIIVDMTELTDMEIFSHPLVGVEGLIAVGAGVFGDKLDDFLKERGCTCGHYPASLKISTVGGWVNTKSNGHHSVCFGNIENLVVAVEGVNGKGEILRLADDDLEKVFRMEGTTMMVTKIWLKIFKIPSSFYFQTFSFPNIRNVLDYFDFLTAQRNVMKEKDVELYTVRAYDFFDATFITKLGKEDKIKSWFVKKIQYAAEKFLCRSKLVRGQLFTYGKDAPWTVIAQTASWNSLAAQDVAKIIELHAVKECNGKNLGPEIAQKWYENPYKQNYEKLKERYEAGMIVDTFDCVPQKDMIAATYDLLRAVFFRFGIVGAHIGLDKDEPYFYLTFASTGKSKEKYLAIWDAILAQCKFIGARTTHHHGIGRLKGREGLQRVYEELWVDNAVKTKKEMDPHNILNSRHPLSCGFKT